MLNREKIQLAKKLLRLGVLSSVCIFTLACSTSSVASALNRPEDSTQSENHVIQAHEASTRLANAKLKACKTREKVINSSMQRIAARGTKHIDVFDKIAARVEAFANSKGKKPDNYGVLVADVNAKKAAAQAALDKIKTESVSFKCDGTDPKGAAEGFKADLKTEIAALKDYKTALKNLIVAVRSANAATDNTSGGNEQ